jgi:hypothetical protein
MGKFTRACNAAWFALYPRRSVWQRVTDWLWLWLHSSPR